MSDNKNIIPSSIRIILPFIPFIGICFIIAGYIYFAIIFNHFNIQINQYLDLNEIITLFLPRLLYLIFILFLPFVLDIIFPPFVDKDSDAENNDGIINFKTLIIEEIKFLYKSNKGYFVFYLVIILVDILYFIQSFFFTITIREGEFYFFLAINILLFGRMLLLVLLKWININYQKIYSKKLNHYFSFYFIIYHFCFFLLMTVAISYVEIYDLYQPNTKKISFHYNNSPLTTTDQILFIGQTRSYLFLHNKSTKTTHVYERNNIKNFTIEDSKSKSYSPDFHRYHPLYNNK